MTFSIYGAEIFVYLHRKIELRPLSHTTQKSKFKMNHRLNVRAKTIKFVGKKIVFLGKRKKNSGPGIRLRFLQLSDKRIIHKFKKNR